MLSAIPGLGWTESIFGKKKSMFQLAKGKTLAIPMDMHKANRNKVCDLMKSKGKNGIILMNCKPKKMYNGYQLIL